MTKKIDRPHYKLKAKFSGTCRRCAGPIAVGDEVQWKKGQGANHLACAPTLTGGQRERLAQVSKRQMEGKPEPKPPAPQFSWLPEEIAEAMRLNRGNIPNAAKSIGMSKEGLRRRLIMEKKRAGN